MPRSSAVLQTSLYVDDLGAAVAFYRDLFDLELFVTEHRMTALGVAGRQFLRLFRRGAGSDGRFIPPHHGDRNPQLCFAVPFGEPAAWDPFLQERGIAVESRLHRAPGGTSLYFRDPEGNSIEVDSPGLSPNA
jgi:catechol 2,3-dioxygenase-like lactoylglutathione lyase family enzyme